MKELKIESADRRIGFRFREKGDKIEFLAQEVYQPENVKYISKDEAKEKIEEILHPDIPQRWSPAEVTSGNLNNWM